MRCDYNTRLYLSSGVLDDVDSTDHVWNGVENHVDSRKERSESYELHAHSSRVKTTRWDDMIWYDMIWYDTIWYDMIDAIDRIDMIDIKTSNDRSHNVTCRRDILWVLLR